MKNLQAVHHDCIEAAFKRFSIKGASLVDKAMSPVVLRALLGGGAGGLVGAAAAPEGHRMQGALALGALGAGLGGVSGQIGQASKGVGALTEHAMSRSGAPMTQIMHNRDLLGSNSL
jgi:hypothetical protein